MKTRLIFAYPLIALLYTHLSIAEPTETVAIQSLATAATQSENRTVAKQYEGIAVTVNINTAGAEELATLLLGIGSNKAQMIVDFREKNGPFDSLEELMDVKGIGPATVEKNRDRILL